MSSEVISIPSAARCSGSTCGTTIVDAEKIPNHEQKDLDLEAQSRKRLSTIRYTVLDIYRRLFSLVFLSNMAIFIYVITSQQKLLALVNATAANVLVCALARQPLVINALFLLVCSIPRSAPLRLRRLAAKVYHYGGVHSGAGVAAFVWYTGFVGLISKEYWAPRAGTAAAFSALPLALAYLILALLAVIIVVAYPTFRVKRHDVFELTHRFAAWLVLAVFVVLLLAFSDETRPAQQPLRIFLVRLPAFWLLILSVLALLHPWLLLRKVRVHAEPLSAHAVRLHMSHTATSFGKGIQLATHPLRDWHAFATFPNLDRPDDRGLSILVSKAGDWTAARIAHPPTYLWTRGVLISGFAYAMRIFTRLVVVTTGSGIGPCLSFLADGDRPALRVLWQTRSPRRTYGDAILGLVAGLDPCACVIDTDRAGRVDMLPVVRRLYHEFAAEAVCVISNPVVTRRVVFELEARGIPAFGPIFDS